ncbi:MAG: hypothetical protein JJE16_00540 [Nitrospiraceae bacterium]|nr:hypothetical protein [Nitrospiraceae bacterium]
MMQEPSQSHTAPISIDRTTGFWLKARPTLPFAMRRRRRDLMRGSAPGLTLVSRFTVLGSGPRTTKLAADRSP